MKVKKDLFKIIVRVSAMLLMIVFLCACETTDKTGITITVEDGAHTYIIQKAEAATVSDILEYLGIDITADDKVSLNLDEKITEDTVIEIKRKCTVTVINGEIEKRITCVGGTVADALKLAKIKLKDTQTANFDMDEPLIDGMCICIIRKGVKKEKTEESPEKDTEKQEKETPETETKSDNNDYTEYYDGTEEDYSYDEPSEEGGGSYVQPSSPDPEEQETERYEISREYFPDIGDENHGVMVITYSDLTQEEIRY